MTSIDTEIPGSPQSIRAAATWLRSDLATNLDGAAEEFNKAGLDAEEVWDSPAGADFREAIKRGDTKTTDLLAAAQTLADDLDALAHSLERCQSDMDTVRSDASAKGLTVSGFLIHDPGPVWDRPQRPTGDDPVLTQEYEQAQRLWEEQDAKVEAFNHASSESDRIHRAYQSAGEDFAGRYSTADHASWMVSVGDIAFEGLAAGAAAYYVAQASKFTRIADDLAAQAAAKAADMAANPNRYRTFRGGGWNPLNWLRVTRESGTLQRIVPNVHNSALWNADQAVVDSLDAQSRAARELADEARSNRLPGTLKTGGRVLGAAGLGLGIWSDLDSGESATQAVVSQGGGFAASLAAGAATGAVVGSIVPVGGTIVGAVVGTAVGAVAGIFSDGVIDSLFENGPDVGAALSAGWDAVQDVGSAIGSWFGFGG